MISDAPQETDENATAKTAEAQQKNKASFLWAGMTWYEQLPFADVEAALEVSDNLEIPALRSSDALLATEVGNCTDYPVR